MASKKKQTSAKTTIERKQRPSERIPVGGHRDKLTVQYHNPDYLNMYATRWVEDTHESGPRIYQFIQGGWTFVDPADAKVGQLYVYTTEDVGSIVRRPSGSHFVYLMKIERDLYEADQKEKQNDIDALEKDMLRERDAQKDDGQYGGGKITRSF